MSIIRHKCSIDRKHAWSLRVLRWLVMAAPLLLIGGCLPVAPSPLRELPPTIEPAECPFALQGEVEGRDYACGILRVPQMRDDLEGMQFGIFFARLNATAPDASAPLLFLAGGPGASGVYDAPLLASTLAPLRVRRDVIFFDIRGAGFSQPRIDCTAFAEGGAGPECMTMLRRQGIEPMAFNTTQAAADAADLLTALGYEQADLVGVSYGTRLALEMLRTQPQLVRAVVLDSTVAPETLSHELQAIGDYQAKLWPYADCEQESVCSGRFGAMAGRFLALLNRLDDANGAMAVDAPMPDAAALYNLTTLALGRPDLMALMPLIVDELDRGETATYRALIEHEFDLPQPVPTPLYAFERFTPLFDAYLRSLPDDAAQTLRRDVAALAHEHDKAALLDFLDTRLPSHVAEPLRTIAVTMTAYERARLFAVYGADLALYDHRSLGDVKTIIDCQEEIPFVDAETVRQNQAVIPLPALLPPYDFAASVEADQRACLDMGLRPAPVSFKAAVASDTPVLLLSGTQDSVTPALWAALAMESLPNAQHVLFPAYGHALLYHAGACVVELALAFLDDPTQPVDASCAPPIAYALERPLLVALTGRMWRLQGWAGQVADGPPITAFFSGGRVTGRGGCSPYAGDFSLHDNRLRVDDLQEAGGVCTEAEQTLQAAFLEALRQAHTLTMGGDRMMLTTAAGDLLIFAAE